LSNAGTWFIGRLQTERDKARVMEGLEGAGAGTEFDRQEMERILAGLGKRRFLLHNVHEDQAVVFSTRWVMSYLAGPFTRDQIKQLMENRQPPADEQPEQAPRETPVADDGGARPAKPALPPGIEQAYLPLDNRDSTSGVVYFPYLLGAAEVTYHNARHKVNSRRSIMAYLEVDDGPVPVDWDHAELQDRTPADLANDGIDGADYAAIADAAGEPKNFTKWERAFKSWLRTERPLVLYKSPNLKMVSEPEETEGEFRARLQVLAREKRDTEAQKLRDRFDRKIRAVEQRVLKARQKVDEQQSQAVASKIETALSVGTAVLGAFMGRKRSSISSAGSALRKAGRMRKESSDAAIAREALVKAQADLEALNEQFEAELSRISEAFDAQSEALEHIDIRPKTSDIDVQYFGIAWEPRARGGGPSGS
jgi:hypothetical protein